MTFTLVSHLREQLSEFVRSKTERKRKEEADRERLLIEVRLSYSFSSTRSNKNYQADEAKTRGTIVTHESFLAWKARFDKELAAKKLKDQEEKLKNFSPKERDEYKKLATRLSGMWFVCLRSLFAQPAQAANCSNTKIGMYLKIRFWKKKELP